MKKILIMIYMFIFHPMLFWKYTIRDSSRYFLANGNMQNIKTRNMIIGRRVRVGNFTRINFYDSGMLKIGNGCYIGQRNTFLVGEDIIIGDNVLMASDICISSENHGTDPMDPKGYAGQSLRLAPVTIGDGCWIGEKVIILSGVKIGEKSIIGAGSVVTKNIPSYCIAVGNPAKVIKKYDLENNSWVSVRSNEE